eukprot:jgi/Undpi1/10000/HiC_scaffold_28.g12454.m1
MRTRQSIVESHRLDHRRQAELLLDQVISARQATPIRLPSQPNSTITQTNKTNTTSSTGSGSSTNTTSTSTTSGSRNSSSSSGPDGVVEASTGGVGAASREPEVAGHGGDGVGGFPELGMRVGIAGPPGAGKSSFIEVLGKDLTAKGNRVAVISIDPSSLRTGGSILGDKTRMHELSRDPSAFVRGCPARGVLGGISQYTHDVVLLCQVAGYDPVIVETVGLGQSEVEVEHTVDMLVLLLPPAGGDDLQVGSKKGIVEVADAIVVNKADGELEKAARATASDYSAALCFARRKISCWNPPVLRCSALRATGVGQVWEQVVKFRSAMKEAGLLDKRRRRQATHWVQRHLQQQLMERAGRNKAVEALSKSLEPELALGKLSPRAAAEMLADCLLRTDSQAR